MVLSNEMRKLENRWATRGIGSGWPKFLEWMEIDGLRGWKGQRIEFPFPIVAIVGENGSGKSTIIQCADAVYRYPEKKRFASEYFPDTIWDKLENIKIDFCYKEGPKSYIRRLRKPTDRWRGNPERPERYVDFIDLGRIQPVPARLGYRRLANPQLKETGAEGFEKEALNRLSNIIGRKYEAARMALTSADNHRRIPVVSLGGGVIFSGFHQGAGEITMTELLQVAPKQNSLLLIDEVETSLHPRAQRKLIRDLAELCRLLDLQIILTTHSAVILEELPLDGRIYIMDKENRVVVRGVSPEFAMTKMDEGTYPECDVYVEDAKSATLLKEILVEHSRASVLRCRFISFGSAQVGLSLGQMIVKKNFPRPSCVFLDGDQQSAPGCNLLPGDDAPERVVFGGLETKEWAGVAERIGRSHTDIVDACKRAMVYGDHKDWLHRAAEELIVGSDSLWEALCRCWVVSVLKKEEANKAIKPIEDSLVELIPISPTSPRLPF